MDATVFFWAVVSAVFAGLQMFTGKIIAHHKEDSALNSLLTYGVSGVLVITLWLLNPVVPTHWEYIAIFGIASGLVHGVGNIMRIDALSHIDSTIYFPINKVLGPLFVVLCGVFLLGEKLSQAQALGVGLSLLVPLLLISSSEHHRQSNLRRGLLLLVVSTLLTAGAMVLVKLAAEESSSVLFMMFMSQIGGITLSLATYAYQKRGRMRAHITSYGVTIGSISGLLSFVSFYAMVTALHSGFISIVYTINAHYILIPIFLSVWWYGEHMNLRKFAAVALSCITLSLLY